MTTNYETLRNTKLVDEALRICKTCDEKSVTGGLDLYDTFGDLDGRELYFPGTKRPSKRLLGIHAATSWSRCLLPTRFPKYDSSDDGRAERLINMYKWTEK